MHIKNRPHGEPEARCGAALCLRRSEPPQMRRRVAPPNLCRRKRVVKRRLDARGFSSASVETAACGDEQRLRGSGSAAWQLGDNESSCAVGSSPNGFGARLVGMHFAYSVPRRAQAIRSIAFSCGMSCSVASRNFLISMRAILRIGVSHA